FKIQNLDGLNIQLQLKVLHFYSIFSIKAILANWSTWISPYKCVKFSDLATLCDDTFTKSNQLILVLCFKFFRTLLNYFPESAIVEELWT
ncbi:hypothetical protein, partial [Mesomycoplasma hyorhinis]|uniref:hypothetical protein n=1 Tax=Mesomycoplasma hyorhinis TaxID=2100 RepID=UPI001C0453C9